MIDIVYAPKPGKKINITLSRLKEANLEKSFSVLWQFIVNSDSDEDKKKTALWMLKQYLRIFGREKFQQWENLVSHGFK